MSGALLTTRRSLAQDALGVLLATVYLVIAGKLAVVGAAPDLPHLHPVGHGWFLFGETEKILAARHHGGYHAAHQLVVGLLFGQARAPALVGLLYTSATIALLAMWAPRRWGGPGWIAPLLYAATPFVVMFGPIPSHEAAAIFWLLVTWWLLEHLARYDGDVEGPVPWPAWVALTVAAMMAAMADHGGWIGVACLAIVASWSVDLSRRTTLVTPTIAAGAALAGAFAAVPRGGAQLILYTMDVRFFDGFDHLLRVGHTMPAMLAWPALVVIALWPLLAVFATLRRRSLPASPLIGTLYVVAVLELVIFREPGWSSNLAWFALLSALTATSLTTALSMRLARSRVGTSPVLQPVLGVALVSLLVVPTGLQARAVFSASARDTLHFVQGMRTAQFEGVARQLVSIADAIVDADEVIYLGPGTLCTMECLTIGAPKRFVTADTLAQDGVPDAGVLVIRTTSATTIEALDEAPGLEVAGYRILDPQRRLSRTLRRVQLRHPLPRILPRAFARPGTMSLFDELGDAPTP